MVPVLVARRLCTRVGAGDEVVALLVRPRARLVAGLLLGHDVLLLSVGGRILDRSVPLLPVPAGLRRTAALTVGQAGAAGSSVGEPARPGGPTGAGRVAPHAQ